jgi:hypothetical protein
LEDKELSEFGRNEKSENTMSDFADAVRAQSLIRGAFPEKRYGTAEAAYRAAFRKLKLKSERRARSFWEATAKIVRAHEMKALERARLEEARNEYRRSQHWIATLEEALHVSDADFNSDQITALRSVGIGHNSAMGHDAD